MVENGVREEVADLKKRIALFKDEIIWDVDWMSKAQVEMELQMRNHETKKKYVSERIEETKKRLKLSEERLKELTK